MALTDDSRAWYELQTKRGNTFVLQDSILPAANEGRIYLFNADRKAIVEYDKAIVADKLVLLDAQQQQQADADFGGDWESVSGNFLKAHGVSRSNSTDKTSEDAEEEPEASIDEASLEESSDSDDFDDDDFDDDDDADLD
jgi:hypothetical protein